MIMMGDRKKTVAAILGPTDKEKAKTDDSLPEHEMMKEFIDAVHAKDHVAAADAFKALHTEYNSGAPDVEEASED